MNDQIQVGDAVYMAGSPDVKMTVTGLHEGKAIVEWITRDGDLKSNVVPPLRCGKSRMVSDPNEQARRPDDDVVVDWEDFEQMTDRVLALPPQSDDD